MMKKLWIVALCLIMTLSMCTLNLAAAEEEVVLNVVYNTGTGMLPKLDDYNLWDGVKVNWIGYPENELETKITLEMLSGAKSYDLAITQASGAKMYGSMGLLAPLDPLDDWDDVFAGNREQHSLGSTIYGYPMICDICVLYYNAELLEAAGYSEPPKTYDEFRQMAIHLTQDKNGVRGDEPGFDPENIVVWGSEYKGVNGGANCVEMCCYLYANGLRYIDKDFDNMTYKVMCNTPEFVDTVQWVCDNYEKYHIYPQGYVNYDYSEFDAMFTEGKVAMCINWPYMFGSVNAEGSPVAGKVGVAALPQGKVSNASAIGGWSISVFKDSKNLDAAKKLAAIIASKEGSNAFNEVTGAMIPRQSFVEGKIAQAEQAGDMPQKDLYQAMLSNLANGAECDFLMTDTAASDLMATTAKWLNIVMSEQMSVQEGMDQLTLEMEEILDSHQYMK